MQSNRMTKLLDKIERKLHLGPLNLPDHLKKEVWADVVIANETLDTFSRFFPNQVTITIHKHAMTKDGFYLIDEDIGDDVEIIGIKDINWRQITNCHYNNYEGFTSSGFYASGYGTDDIALLQARANQTSLISNVIIPKFVPPNKVRLETASGDSVNFSIEEYPITIFIKHSPNLMTILPTMMETFEKLAIADVANFLYGELKYYDGLETVFTNSDLKLSDLESAAGTRDDIVEKLDEAHVSAANGNQPMILTI